MTAWEHFMLTFVFGTCAGVTLASIHNQYDAWKARKKAP